MVQSRRHPSRATSLAFFVFAPCAIAQSTSWLRESSLDAPAARSGHALSTDLLHREVVMFGGQGIGLLGDTWLFHDGAWQQVASGTGPSPRRGHAMAYDQARQRVVLFGGQDSSLLGDTWLWNGTTWSQLAIGGPTPRVDHAMAYDALRQRVVLFGGSVAPGSGLADTWQFDGAGWTQVVTVGGPVARHGQAMAFDSGSQSVLMFGGRSPSLGALADTWRWNGVAWVPVFTAHFPPARSEHAMARDAAGRVTVFGGFSSQQLADTWRYDGVDWRQVLPVGAPPSPRAEGAMADGQLAGPLLFGGENGGLLRDAWTLADAAMPYGQGCGTPPLGFVPDPLSPPLLGQLATAVIADAPTLAAGVMMGWSRDYFGAFPLPLSLTGLGLTGCDLLQSAEITGLSAGVLTSSSLAFSLAIPNAAQLLGVEVFVQAYAFAPGENPAQLVVSNGIEWSLSATLTSSATIVEGFDDETQLDVGASSGSWFGGQVQFGSIGGDGRHGEFDLNLATATGTFVDGRQVYVIDCDHTVIPAANTLDGVERIVTDGRFWFSSMTVSADAHLRFVGASPAVLTVSGRIEVFGAIDVAGQSNLVMPTPTQVIGQPGAVGGAFGGRGGNGGDRCFGIGAGSGQYSGHDGEAARVLAGHAYAASTVATPGQGSELFPASGLNADMLFGTNPPPTTPLHFALSAVAGGGGGGLWSIGANGMVTSIEQGGVQLPNQAMFMGPLSPSSGMVQLFPVPAGARSSEHFLLGGAGGGGTASNTTMSLALARFWAPGAGGGGGGGAMALRAGTQLFLDANGALLANGGRAADRLGVVAGPQVAPAGGGSGGSIVLQCGGVTGFAGLIDVRGGKGGTFRVTAGGGLSPGGGTVEIHGGDGGSGFVRYERTFPPFAGELATMQPPATPQNLGTLIELDPQVATRSKFYSTFTNLPVDYQRYELEATFNGVPVLLSDDPAVSPLQATLGQPVRAMFQAARLDLVTGEVLELGPWRAVVGNRPGQIGIAAEGFNSFRFQLVLDRSLTSLSVAIDTLRVVFQN